MSFRIVNATAYGVALVTISPNANDGIQAADLATDDDKDLLNTKTTANRGDQVDIGYGDATGWTASKLIGTWAKEA